MEENRISWRLREQPPVWPRRNADEDEWPKPQRWLREPERYEANGLTEIYPGAVVMEDLADSDDATSNLRILGRYTVIRVLLLSRAGVLLGPQLASERRIALEHLSLLPNHDWERRVLERVAGLCRETPLESLLDAVLTAGEASAKRGHFMGAFGFFREGFELAVDRGWWRAAERAARGIARLARIDEAPMSARLWDKRAFVVARRSEGRGGWDIAPDDAPA